MLRNTALHPRNRSLVVNFSALKSRWSGHDRMCLEGDLGEGMCAMGKWGSGPYASEIYLLFPVMKLMKKGQSWEAGGW